LTIFGTSIFAVAAHALLAAAPASAATPRVLAIRFGPDLEVNPVTKGYVNHQLSEAEKHHNAALIEFDTPGWLSGNIGSDLRRNAHMSGTSANR
jgi:membrane-bound ClpP family serine protease